MTKIRSSCLFVGDGFSPSSFSDGRSIDLHDAIEPGAFGLRGRFKGQPTPFGSASIQMPENEGNDWDSFYQLVDLLEGYLVDLRKAGAERITLFVSVYYDGQCNLGFSAEELGHRRFIIRAKLLAGSTRNDFAGHLAINYFSSWL